MNTELKEAQKLIFGMIERYERALQATQKEREARLEAENMCESLQTTIEKLEYKLMLTESKL